MLADVPMGELSSRWDRWTGTLGLVDREYLSKPNVRGTSHSQNIDKLAAAPLTHSLPVIRTIAHFLLSAEIGDVLTLDAPVCS